MTKKEIKNLFYDGFNSKLIETACFESLLEIPKLRSHETIEVPSGAVPFSERKKKNGDQMLVFYEYDPEFRGLVSIPQKYDSELETFKYISTPDCSLYRDMPLVFQLANIAVSRSIGYYYQEKGKYVIPNVRWGDERTYSDIIFSIPPAFAGIPQNDIVSIGSYGCCKSAEDKHYLVQGLEGMLKWLEPKVVIVYGAFPRSIFETFNSKTKFIHIPDWTTQVKGCE